MLYLILSFVTSIRPFCNVFLHFQLPLFFKLPSFAIFQMFKYYEQRCLMRYITIRNALIEHCQLLLFTRFIKAPSPPPSLIELRQVNQLAFITSKNDPVLPPSIFVDNNLIIVCFRIYKSTILKFLTVINSIIIFATVDKIRNRSNIYKFMDTFHFKD